MKKEQSEIIRFHGKHCEEAYFQAERMLNGLRLQMGKEAETRADGFVIRYTVLNTMHSLFFSMKGRLEGEMSIHTEKGEKKVAFISVSRPGGAALAFPGPTRKYIEYAKRICIHAESSFMAGPGASQKKKPSLRR